MSFVRMLISLRTAKIVSFYKSCTMLYTPCLTSVFQYDFQLVCSTIQQSWGYCIVLSARDVDVELLICMSTWVLTMQFIFSGWIFESFCLFVCFFFLLYRHTYKGRDCSPLFLFCFFNVNFRSALLFRNSKICLEYKYY